MKKIIISIVLTLFTCFVSQAQESTTYNSKKFISFRADAIGGDVEEKLFRLGIKFGFKVNENTYIGPIIGYERRSKNPNGNFTFESQVLEYGGFFRNVIPITNKFSFSADVQATFLKDIKDSSNSTLPFIGQVSINAEYRPIEKFSIRLMMGQLNYLTYESISVWQLNYGLNDPAIELTHYF